MDCDICTTSHAGEAIELLLILYELADPCTAAFYGDRASLMRCFMYKNFVMSATRGQFI